MSTGQMKTHSKRNLMKKAREKFSALKSSRVAQTYVRLSTVLRNRLNMDYDPGSILGFSVEASA